MLNSACSVSVFHVCCLNFQMFGSISPCLDLSGDPKDRDLCKVSPNFCILLMEFEIISSTNQFKTLFSYSLVILNIYGSVLCKHVNLFSSELFLMLGCYLIHTCHFMTL